MIGICVLDGKTVDPSRKETNPRALALNNVYVLETEG